jgi:hypothetical protein
VGKRWTWVAWSMLVVFVLSAILAVILEVANGTWQHDAANQTALFLGFGAFMAVGALVVAHRPGNAIGWIFSVIALLAVTGQLASEYATYAYATRSGSLPGAILAAWYSSWPWWLVLALALVFTPLLFPTGRLLSPRWRPVAWSAGSATVALTVLTALQANLGTIGGQVIANPIRVAWVGNPDKSAVGVTLFGLLLLSVVAAFVSGNPVSAVAGRGAPATQVVHLRLRVVAPGGAGRRAARSRGRPHLSGAYRVLAGSDRYRDLALSAL